MKACFILAGVVSVLMLHSIALAGAPNHGVAEFTANGTWIPPKGVKAVQVEMWGAGGGGGTGSGGFDFITATSGGGGGGGAYVRGWLPVLQKQTYTINIGVGGTAGTSDTVSAGGSGSATEVLDGESNVLLNAPGGTGGTAGAIGAPGIGGVGGVPNDLTAFLERAGHAGHAGASMGITANESSNAVQGSVETQAAVSPVAPPGSGGAGGNSIGASDGSAGGRGHVIISW